MWAQSGAREDQILMIESSGLLWVYYILFDLFLLNACTSSS